MWATYNPTLRAGEVGIETDGLTSGDIRYKIGDGSTAWADLPYAQQERYKRVTNVATTYTVAAQDQVIIGNSGSGFTITLPPATGSGRVVEIHNKNTGTVTVDGDGSETISGSANYTLAQWETSKVIDIASGVWVRV